MIIVENKTRKSISIENSIVSPGKKIYYSKKGEVIIKSLDGMCRLYITSNNIKIKSYGKITSKNDLEEGKNKIVIIPNLNENCYPFSITNNTSNNISFNGNIVEPGKTIKSVIKENDGIIASSCDGICNLTTREGILMIKCRGRIKVLESNEKNHFVISYK